MSGDNPDFIVELPLLLLPPLHLDDGGGGGHPKGAVVDGFDMGRRQRVDTTLKLRTTLVSSYVKISSARPSVCSSVRTFIRLFVTNKKRAGLSKRKGV